MLRVGLTGNLGSGKSTVGELFADLGAHTLSSDAMARELMEPGQALFNAIVAHFGAAVLTRDGALDRGVLARMAFAENRVEELNAIVHPAVLARQATLAAALAVDDPHGVLLIESALIFESTHIAAGERFDTILLVTAPLEQKIARFTKRTGLDGAEAARRLALQLPDEKKRALADYVIENNGSVAELRAQVEALWPVFRDLAR